MERDAKLPLVRDFMNPRVSSLPVELEIEEALLRLRRAGHSGAPVLDADGALVGVLSEVDCMKVLASAAFHAMPSGPVGDFMTRDVATLTPDTDLFAAVHRAQQTRFRRFPVIDGGRVVGIVTVRDLDKALWEIAQARTKLHRAPDHPPGAAWDPRK